MCLNLLCDASNHVDDSMCCKFLCGASLSPVHDDDEVTLILLFWWRPNVSVFWIVVQPLLFVALRVQMLCSRRSMKMIHELLMLIFVVAVHSLVEMVLSSKATSLSRLPVRNEALGVFFLGPCALVL